MGIHRVNWYVQSEDDRLVQFSTSSGSCGPGYNSVLLLFSCRQTQYLKLEIFHRLYSVPYTTLGIHYVLYDFYSVVNQSSGKMD